MYKNQRLVVPVRSVWALKGWAYMKVILPFFKGLAIFLNPILFAICTSTFSKLCKNMYTEACRRVLTSTPL
jgi:cytochrome c biogenesis protein CcdA